MFQNADSGDWLHKDTQTKKRKTEKKRKWTHKTNLSQHSSTRFPSLSLPSPKALTLLCTHLHTVIRVESKGISCVVFSSPGPFPAFSTAVRLHRCLAKTQLETTEGLHGCVYLCVSVFVHEWEYACDCMPVVRMCVYMHSFPAGVCACVCEHVCMFKALVSSQWISSAIFLTTITAYFFISLYLSLSLYSSL